MFILPLSRESGILWVFCRWLTHAHVGQVR